MSYLLTFIAGMGFALVLVWLRRAADRQQEQIRRQMLADSDYLVGVTQQELKQELELHKN